MDIIKNDLSELLDALDVQRNRLNMSYQDVADACSVSKATISRVFNRVVEPQVSLLKKIAAAVNYVQEQPPIILEDFSKDAYIDFLQRTIVAEREEHRHREAQAEARHNRVVAAKDRRLNLLTLLLILIAVAFIVWLIIDVTHPTVGWFQREVSYRSSDPTIPTRLRAINKHLFA